MGRSVIEASFDYEDVAISAEDLYSKPWVDIAPETTVSVAPPCLPVSVASAKQHQDIYTSQKDAMIALYLATAAARITKNTGFVGVETTFVETQSRYPADMFLRFRPFISMTSVQVYETDDNNTLTTINSSSYTVSPRGRLTVRNTSAWPAVRDINGYVYTYKAGLSKGSLNLSDATDVSTYQANLAAAYPDYILAVLQLASLYFEGREGQSDETHYEIEAKTFNGYPPMLRHLMNGLRSMARAI